MASDVRRGIAALARLHRDPEAAAAFTGPIDGYWHPFFGLLPSELSEPTLSVAQWSALETDRYVTLNGMRPAKGRSRCDPFRDLHAGKRRDDQVTALNAVWADFDCYKRGLTPEQVLTVLGAKSDTGELPPWSLAIHSGRGLWLVWLLRRDDSELPPMATEENKAACLSINRALVTRFDYLGADPRSTNVGRVTRVPGSINSRAVSEGNDGIVRWEYCAPCPLYTVAEITAAFPSQSSRILEKRRNVQRGHSRLRPAWVDRGTYRARRAPRGAAFSSAKAVEAVPRRWGHTLLELLYLCSFREGFRKGHRHYAVFWIAHLLNRALPPAPGKRTEIVRICRDVNATFKPPLSVEEVGKATTNFTAWPTKGNVSNGFLAQQFDVTDEESALLRKLKPSAASRQERRRAALASVRVEWIDAKGTNPTVDDLTRELDLVGHSVSRATVARDLQMLDADAAPPTPPSAQGEGTSAKSETERQERGTHRGQA